MPNEPDPHPGAIYGRLKDRFPRQESSAGLVMGADTAQPFFMHRFLAPDGKHLLQCAPELFTVNVLGDYGAFSEFENLIGDALRAFYSEAVPQKLLAGYPRHRARSRCIRSRRTSLPVIAPMHRGTVGLSR